MSAEKKIDRMDVAFADRSDAYRVLFDLVGDHPRASEIMILIQQYESRCADVAEAKVEYVAKEPTEPTLDTEVIDLSALERLDRIEGKFVAACGIAYQQEQRLKVVESTLADSKDAREPTEPTVTTENRLDMTDDRLSGIGKVLSNQTERLVAIGEILSGQNKWLDKIEAKFVAAAQVVEERNQRLRVLETTLADCEDARESWNASWTELMIRISQIEEKFRAAEKEAAAETNRQLEEDTQKAILSGKQ